MYYYLYDAQLSDKKYATTIAKIETRLTDLDINGKINRLSFLKNIEQVLAEEIKRGVKTIVVVGNDKTIGQVINLVRNFNVSIGLIPIGPDNNIAKLLGIPLGESACDIISSRIVRKLDVGEINGYLFLTSLEMGGKNIALDCDGNYTITALSDDNIINISNLSICHQTPCDPEDEKIDIFVESKEKKLFQKSQSAISHFMVNKIRLTGGKAITIFLSDEKKITKTPADIYILPKKLKMIVGKQRYF